MEVCSLLRRPLHGISNKREPFVPANSSCVAIQLVPVPAACRTAPGTAGGRHRRSCSAPEESSAQRRREGKSLSWEQCGWWLSTGTGGNGAGVVLEDCSGSCPGEGPLAAGGLLCIAQGAASSAPP